MNNLLSERFVLSLLLKFSSQIQIDLKEINDSTKEFMKFLIKIAQDDTNEEDKNQVHWENSLIQSWEKLIDKSETKNEDFY